MDSITFTLNNIDHVAQQIVEMLDGRRTVCLYGPMGAGKTTLIRALCAALGVGDVVTSPTFALVNEYRRPSGAPIFHFDFYRVGSPHEVFDMGYEEYFYGNHGGL
ncbi:MAG: tRNA (adenosine(37)-N6)-threonylcarbamoyltransferase complex ATPase subunit type 1 TsaE, partial [Bacteroidales bacterium]|nr:tRNA (adenosine(37)-N6)-threonylcarbamoyltransferase complex ATPase subunit type 1 TsaE [Bacteroidales bacterium]